MNLLPALLPIAWAVVSTLVALLLYRSSRAFFEQRSGRPAGEGGGDQATPYRRVRLVGSVVIAGLAFLALKTSTPSEYLMPVSSADQQVPRASVKAVDDAASALSNAVTELQACAQLAPPVECGAQLDQIERRSAEMERAAKALKVPGPSTR